MSEYEHLPEEEKNHWLLFKRYGSERSREWLLEHHKRLPGWVYKKLKTRLGPHNPEDVVQEAAVAFVEAVDLFDIDLGWRFSTYAHSRISGKIRNYVTRNENKERQRNQRSVSYEELGENGAEPSADDRMEENVLGGQIVDDLRELIRGSLKDDEFAVFELKFLQAMEADEIAEALQMSPQTVRNVIRRVRKRLKPILVKAGFGVPD